jgi:hypothetical protein
VTNASGLEATLDDAINVDNSPAFDTASGTLLQLMTQQQVSRYNISNRCRW